MMLNDYQRRMQEDSGVPWGIQRSYDDPQWGYQRPQAQAITRNINTEPMPQRQPGFWDQVFNYNNVNTGSSLANRFGQELYNVAVKPFENMGNMAWAGVNDLWDSASSQPPLDAISQASVRRKWSDADPDYAGVW
jgi:hypothetical protein